MILRTERTDARTWPREQLAELFSEGFPAFITADPVSKEYIGRVREWFADLDLMLTDEDGVPVAAWMGRADPLGRAGRHPPLRIQPEPRPGSRGA